MTVHCATKSSVPQITYKTEKNPGTKTEGLRSESEHLLDYSSVRLSHSPHQTRV